MRKPILTTFQTLALCLATFGCGPAANDPHVKAMPASKATADAAKPFMVLTGTLAYRSTCRDGVAAPFQGHDGFGPSIARLYLTDRLGSVIGSPATPALDGKFKIRIPYQGQFALRILAGELSQFWLDGSLTAIPVSVPRYLPSTELPMGTLCVDADPPQGFLLHAEWDRTQVTAPVGTVLHLESQPNPVTLRVETPPAAAAQPLVRWTASSGSLLYAGAVSAAWSSFQNSETLRVTIGDGLGAVTAFTYPVFVHKHRVTAIRVPAFVSFAAPLTTSLVDVRVSDPAQTSAWWQTAEGLEVQVGASDTRASVDVATVPVAVGGLLQVATTFTIEQIDRGAEFSLSVSADSRSAIKLAIRNDVGRLVKRITLADGSSYEENIETLWWVGRQIWIRLTYDPVLHLAYGEDSLGGRLLVVKASLDGSMVTPVLGVTRYGGGAIRVGLSSLSASAGSIALKSEAFAANGLRCLTSATLACREVAGGSEILIAQPDAHSLHTVHTEEQAWFAASPTPALDTPILRVERDSLYPIDNGQTYLY